MGQLRERRVVEVGDDQELKVWQRGHQARIHRFVPAQDRAFDVHRGDLAPLDSAGNLPGGAARAERQGANRQEAVAGGGPVAPARQPGRLELTAELDVLDAAPTGEEGRSRAHIGRALIVGRTTKCSHPAAGATKVAGQDREVGAGGRDRGRLAVRVGDARFALVGGRLPDQRRRVPLLRPLGRGTGATGRVDDRCLPDQIL